MNFLSYLPYVMAMLACGVSVVTLIQGVMALRAKDRIRQVLSARAGQDDDLRALMVELSHARHHLDEAQQERARSVVLMALNDVSDADRRLVRDGLHQPSRRGERRFLEDLLIA